ASSPAGEERVSSTAAGCDPASCSPAKSTRAACRPGPPRARELSLPNAPRPGRRPLCDRRPRSCRRYDPPVLYGRDRERARIGALLGAARASRSGVLLVSGEPGVGKTALLEDTRERAPDMYVLSARGIESESELPFAALHQLLRPALGNIDRLPKPQASAL